MKAQELSAADFLGQYFLGTRHSVELRALPRKIRHFTRGPNEIRRFVQQYADQNVFFGCATREGGGKKFNCRELPALWADLDFKTIPESHARQVVRTFRLQPSIVIESGGGLHIYWLLDVPADPHHISIEPILRGLAATLGGDLAAAEIARIMRLPGTINYKYQPPRECRLMEVNWERRFALHAFKEYQDFNDGLSRQKSVGPVIIEGNRNTALASFAGKLRRLDLHEDELRASLLAINQRRCIPPLSAEEIGDIARSVSRYQPKTTSNSFANPWNAAQEAAGFISSEDKQLDFLEPRILAPEAITEFFSPRGLGKTLVAQYLAVKQARLGKRVLYLDRDNPRREVRKRLRAWGAGDTPGLKIMTREDVPPLTDKIAWQSFPYSEYDLIILDSLDSAAEGVGEQDSAKPSRAIAPLLDIAHRENGPAVLVLGNCVKSGAHSRGSGVVEDRCDISYEIRDATDLKPSGSRPWVEELPMAGASSWAIRSSRRKVRTVYRLAFVPSKFRLGEEPEPFILEVNLSDEPWTLRDVSDEVDVAGARARAEHQQEAEALNSRAISALTEEVSRRAKAAEKPMYKDSETVPFLRDRKLTRRQARDLLDQGNGTHWRLVDLKGERGNPTAVLPVDWDFVDGTYCPNMADGGNTISSKAMPDAESRDLDLRREPSMRSAKIMSSQQSENADHVDAPLCAKSTHSSVERGAQEAPEDEVSI